jgi:hypothetical protein
MKSANTVHEVAGESLGISVKRHLRVVVEIVVTKTTFAVMICP